jgi:hypothetical protein
LQVTNQARHGGHSAPPVGAEDRVQVLAQRGPSIVTTGRTSTDP